MCQQCFGWRKASAAQVDRRPNVLIEERLHPCGAEPAGGRVAVRAVEAVAAAVVVETEARLAIRCQQPIQLFGDEVDASACLPANVHGAVVSAVVDMRAEGNS